MPPFQSCKLMRPVKPGLGRDRWQHCCLSSAWAASWLQRRLIGNTLVYGRCGWREVVPSNTSTAAERGSRQKCTSWPKLKIQMDTVLCYEKCFANDTAKVMFNIISKEEFNVFDLALKLFIISPILPLKCKNDVFLWIYAIANKIPSCFGLLFEQNRHFNMSAWALETCDGHIFEKGN